MNFFNFLALLILFLILGNPYPLFIKAKKEKGFLKTAGFILAGGFTALLFLVIVLWKAGAPENA